MAARKARGNRIAPPHFIAFGVVIALATPLAAQVLPLTKAVMLGFDLAALAFLATCVPLLRIRSALKIEKLAVTYDANRTLLLGLTGIVTTVLLVVMGVQTVGGTPEPATKVLILSTVVLAWLFSNSVYALHYAHLAYIHPSKGCYGLNFPETKLPLYWDFVYFAFTLGMTFQTSDVEITNERIRRVVTVHSFAAFVFNIGILAFTISVIGN
ncbi:DUF1345 domain-containing protein [Sphingomonas sabuli]|uniref:DUF1345 domain-containing protein n=1 Tax=Sphingomonas sabuli TaxID=2764186 RepID=A0A7G9L0N7_9SPHN|nr:DUF1345 domain-containing protein [Sphingomonas sabuli]QNM82186.1 DUF1345 domain-containing protein [Sphingomonas sabuli]